MKASLFLKLLLICGWGLAACASQSSREIMESSQSSARPRPASMGSDHFYSDNLPERSLPPPGEFFFKHCTLSGRHPYPSASDWECPGPH